MRSEKQTYVDPSSGVEVIQLTNYKGHNHHFYFTNPGWYDNGKRLLFSSDRKNRTNLFGVHLVTGEIEQLTDLEPVGLPRELEFLRACKNPVREEVYFWHDLKLLALDLVSRKTRTLYEISPKWCVSMTNCSADGCLVYFSANEDLSDRLRVDLLRGYVGFREIWKARPLSRIIGVTTDGGGGEVVFEEQYWIGHVNTSPTQSHLLTFCHEGPWEDVDQRIWGFDVNQGRAWKIRPMSGKEYIGHEYWYTDGVRIGYHGGNADGKPILGHIRYDSTGQREWATSYPGHIFSHDENLIVGDAGKVIRAWKYQDGSYLGPRILCRHDSDMRIQQTHPHPCISPDGKQVVFTSNRSGYGQVYMAPLVNFDSLPAVVEE